jgi:hypothetical protein
MRSISPWEAMHGKVWNQESRLRGKNDEEEARGEEG